MSDAGLTLRLLSAVARDVDETWPKHGEEGTTPSTTPEPGTSVTSRQMLDALIETGFDLPSAIVRVARDN
ncbi:hypothetical protein ACGFJC_39820 [Nonomuraea fuscirosea]|uniref:hypothetical protein n=1 Tax=Nonomuraea fuscirosea TaxID=1291556 RepID=UPI0037120984